MRLEHLLISEENTVKIILELGLKALFCKLLFLL